jgi:LuxR family transcriptional regulator, maltose regulon positive regulatory protein
LEAEWELARDLFEQALGHGEAPEALEGLGMAAWWLDDVATVFEARERAFHLYRQRDENQAAGRVALTLAQDHLYFRGEPAVANGWFGRAHRLLDCLERCPEQGWLRVAEADFALAFQHDLYTGKRLATEAASIGRALAIVDLEMMALAIEGFALVCEGKLKEGMARLDEATTAAVSGELQDFYAIGYAYCCMVQACERVRDYERVDQWCRRAKGYGERLRFELLVGVCSTQYASVLIARGQWEEAERELLASIEKLRAIRPPLQGEGVVRLARLRRLQGRRSEAEDLLASCEDHPLALFEASCLALEAGDAAAAAQLAERSLRRGNEADLVERALGLEALLRARLALGSSADAQATLAELQAATDVIGTGPIRASALVCRGLVAASSAAHEKARSALEDAVDLFRTSGAPLDEARARFELAVSLMALGRHEAASAEARAAAAAFATLGATGDARRADELLAEIEASATAVVEGPACAGKLTPREVDVLRLVAEGLSNAQIGATLHLSPFTVKRHVANILTKLELPTRAAAAVYLARRQPR